MASDDVRSDRMYTRDHLWAQLVNGTVVVGLTAYAATELGDIVYVDINPTLGDFRSAGEAFGTIEAVKTTSDLFSPVSGTLKRINPAVDEDPSLVNQDCYGAAWLIELTPSDPSEMAQLLSADRYKQFFNL